MRVDFSKSFIKAASKLTGKMKESLQRMVREVMEAKAVGDITDCKKLVGYEHVYRIRVGGYRAFFIFHVKIVDDTVMFQYLLPRGEAYSKKNQRNLKDKDV